MNFRTMTALAITACLLVHAAEAAQASAPAPQGNAPASAATAPATSSVPAAAIPPPAPPLPPGYSLVPNGYFDQVSQTAKAAIEAGKTNEDNLLSIVKIAGSIVGAILTFGAFLGYTEIRSISNIKKDFKDTLKKSKRKLESTEESLSDLQAMESLLIDVTFLQNKNREIADLDEKGRPDLRDKAHAALKEGELFYSRASELYERRSRLKKTRQPGQDADGAEKRIDQIILYFLPILSTKAPSAPRLPWPTRAILMSSASSPISPPSWVSSRGGRIRWMTQ